MKLVQDLTDCLQSMNLNISAKAGNGHVQVCRATMVDPLISDEATYIFVAVFQVALTGILAVCGMVTNTINIVVFIKMGLRETVNISLLGLAVGDLFSLVFSLWESVCFNPLLQDPDVPVVFTEIEYITGCWPHVCFVRVASYITAYITLERCLCIALPLKVKTIITTTRTKIVIVGIFFVVTATSIPEYYVTQLAWKFYPDKNRTMLGVHFIEERERFESVTLILNNIVMQCAAFVAVVVCTVILIVQLNRKAKWRQQSAATDKSSSGKDRKVIKMISFISVIFIISNLPSCLVFIAMSSTPQLHPSGQNYNMFYVVWSVVYVMEGINSTVSILVYLSMSSKYKAIFCKTFMCRESSTANSETSKSNVDVSQESNVDI